MTVLCAICAADEPQPVICRRCEERVRRDLEQLGKMRKMLGEWREIDPGTPGRDDPHCLALVDNPVLLESGQPDLTVIAATDPRTKRIIAGWHDSECGAASCTDPDCTDPAHRQDAADDVIDVDGELLTEARHIIEQRRLSTPLADVFDCLRVINVSLDWSVRSDRADEFAAIINRCAIALRGVLRDTSDRVIGECTAAHTDRDTCGGPLRFAWIGPLSIEAESQVRPTHVQCSWCNDTWPCDAATLIGMLRVANTGPIPVPRAWAAEVCGIRGDLLRKWIQRGIVTAYPDDQVNLVDVLTRVSDTPNAEGA